jgi:hypothetical protein
MILFESIKLQTTRYDFLTNVTLGTLDNFQLEKYEGRFKVPSVECHFCDDLAEVLSLMHLLGH